MRAAVTVNLQMFYRQAAWNPLVCCRQALPLIPATMRLDLSVLMQHKVAMMRVSVIKFESLCSDQQCPKFWDTPQSSGTYSYPLLDSFAPLSACFSRMNCRHKLADICSAIVTRTVRTCTMAVPQKECVDRLGD